MGGVISMDGFLDKFFPTLAAEQAAYAQQTAGDVTARLYCAFDSAILQLMTSVLFLAGTVCEVTGTTAYLSRCVRTCVQLCAVLALATDPHHYLMSDRDA